MTTRRAAAPVSIAPIAQSILVIRGHRVIIDRDLAAIYGVETRTLNQAVRRNADRFAELERKVPSHDQAIVGILKAIRDLMNPPEPKRRPIGFIELEERK